MTIKLEIPSKKGKFYFTTDSQGGNTPSELGGVKVTRKNLTGFLQDLRLMYALPIKRFTSKMPLGYDDEIVVDGVTYWLPNEEAFRVLIKAKYLLRASSVKSVTRWVWEELNNIGYKWDISKNGYNVPMDKNTLLHVMRKRRPLDACLLPLDEREELFRTEIESYVASQGAVGRLITGNPDSELTRTG